MPRSEPQSETRYSPPQLTETQSEILRHSLDVLTSNLKALKQLRLQMVKITITTKTPATNKVTLGLVWEFVEDRMADLASSPELIFPLRQEIREIYELFNTLLKQLPESSQAAFVYNFLKSLSSILEVTETDEEIVVDADVLPRFGGRAKTQFSLGRSAAKVSEAHWWKSSRKKSNAEDTEA